MSTEEERAHLLRTIAVGGFSPYAEDCDGSTANTLLQWAEELAPMFAPPPPKRANFVRRWYLRLKLRRKMRRLGMLVLVLGTVVPQVGTAQTPSDSLLGTALSRNVIGPWSGQAVRVFCLTWVAERDDRPRVLVVIDAAPADTTLHPLCPNPKGGYFPLWIDGPTCPPGQVSPFAEREWIIVRCSENDLARYRRAAEKKAL